MKAKRKIQVGWLKFRPKILTLQQIVDVGKLFDNVGSVELGNANSVIAEMLTNSNDAAMMQEMLVFVLFRNRVWRWIMRPYIRYFATVKEFQDMLDILTESKVPTLFVMEIILLKDTNISRMNNNKVNSQSL